MDQELENIFPNLSSFGYELTSPATTLYNCIAWSIGDDTNWWWPDGINYWPDDIPCVATVESFCLMYASFDFVVCDNFEVEDGFEKIALYVSPITGQPTHASRQLSNGKWTSKLGMHKDITHNTLSGIENQIYGAPFLFMKRVIIS